MISAFCKTFFSHRIHRFGLVLNLSVALAASTGAAQPVEPDQVMREAVAAQPSVQAARFRLEAARGYADGIGAQPNPTLRLTGTVGDPIEEANSLTFPFELGGRPRLRGESAREEAQARRQDLQAERRRVALMAGQTYYDVWEAQAIWRIARERVVLAEEMAFSSRRRWEVGEISRNQSLRAELEAARARADETTAHADEQVARTRLNQWLARSSDQGLELPLEIPPAPVGGEPGPAELAERPANLPELEALRAEQRAAELQAELANRLGSPNLQLQLYRSRFVGVVEQGIALSISFPLWDWGQFDAEYQRKVGLAQAAAAVVAERLLEVQQRTAAAATRYRAARERLAILQEQVERFVLLSNQARRAYDAGLMTLVEVFDTQNSYRQALQSYVSAQAEVQRTLLQLAWTVNAPFFEEVSREP